MRKCLTKEEVEKMINRILSQFNEYSQHYYFSGAALIKKGSIPLFEYASGFAHRGFGIKNEITTLFDTASITKLFTAAGIVLLENRGMLNFNDKIHRILDLAGTKIPNDVEIRHLLTHTSGIADDADEENGEDYAALFKNSPNYTFRDNIDFLPNFAYKEPNFKAGSNARYNNCAFILLGLAIEKLTGQSYREFISENIFKPFGMESTLFSAKDDTDANIAEGYYLADNQNASPVWKKNIYSFPPIGTADSGAYTTVFDLDRFIRHIRSNSVFEKMLYPQCTISRSGKQGNIRYGYAFEFIEKQNEIFNIYKEGCNPGVCNMLCYYPKSDITFVILANQDCNVWKLQKEVEQMIVENEE
jgi:CubicO group peptidase (beta-lactamase class C family)